MLAACWILLSVALSVWYARALAIVLLVPPVGFLAFIWLDEKLQPLLSRFRRGTSGSYGGESGWDLGADGHAGGSGDHGCDGGGDGGGCDVGN
jgi:hypothetical protein